MTVTIYTTPTCTYCRMAKSYFKEKGVTYKEVDVAADAKAAEHMIEVSGQMGVPVLEINGDIIVGFDRPAIDRALSKKK